MKKVFFFFLGFFIPVAIQAQSEFMISGKLSGFKENALVRIERQNITLDSCYLQNGNFELKGSFEETPTPAHLIINNGDDFIFTSLFIGNETIVINADLADFPNDVFAQGSDYNLLHYEYSQLKKDLNNERKKHLDEMFALKKQGKWNDSLQKAYWNTEEPIGKIRIIDNDLDQLTDEFIDQNYNSYYGLYLMEIYKTKIPKTTLQNYFQNLDSELMNSAYGKSIEAHLKYPDLEVGQKFYDFSAFDENGNERMFSEFFDNKYILLDFSTIYCGFCIQAIPKLEKAKKVLNGKLEIVTFYVDKSQSGFDGLAEKHNENWNILWDKEGRLSDTYAKYKVFGTPTFYLFDPTGKFIKLFQGYSEDLPEQIEKAIRN